MFDPRYKLVIRKESFPKDEAVCLGSQLITLVKFLRNALPSHIWYGTNVEAVGPAVSKYDLNTYKLIKIGDDSVFINYCSEIVQFIWGVFLCLDKSHEEQTFINMKLSAEDELFRSIKLSGILIEIRAFDTSFFEIYSQDEELLMKIAKHFSSKDISSRI